jgi:precorrin-6A/cobalt-precorrin-6A reductase
VFLTTGRQGLAAFAGLRGRCVVRAVDPPSPPLPARTTVVLARGPFTVEEEHALMREHAVEVVVTKDSGGGMTAAKLTAARDLGLPVVVVRRPPVPPGVPVVATVEEPLTIRSARARTPRPSPTRRRWSRAGRPGRAPRSSRGCPATPGGR